MSNRWLRFVIALLALAAAGAAGYRIFQHERRLATERAATRAGDLAAESAIATTLEIRAALHAYVAPGQGHDFWTAKAAMLLDKLRGSLLELDGAASGAGAPLAETLDLSDRLARSERRARDHARAGQALLAGEVVFTESRDLLDAIRLQVARARGQIRQAAEARESDIRREQLILAIGASGILVVALLILVPPGGPLTNVTAAPIALDASEHRTAPGAPIAPDAPEHRAAPSAPIAPDAPKHRTAPGAPIAPDAPVAPVSLSEAASVCTDLARVSESSEISVLLGRASGVLNASGIIIWMASEDKSELYPAASTGYDERWVARLGAIPRAASNLTAGAYRDAAARTTASHGSSAAALAVPLLNPQGSVGVLSAELSGVPDVGPQQLAIATIFAAQLSMLLGSMTTGEAGTQPDAAVK